MTLAVKLTPSRELHTADLALARAAHTWATTEVAAGREGQAVLQQAEWHVHQALQAFDAVQPPTGNDQHPQLAYRDTTADEALNNLEAKQPRKKERV